MALNFVRGVVSQDLKRHVEAAWDLNLTYILSNLIAMSYPGEGVEGMYRNDITQVAAYLDHKHNDHYMIFNLSERNYNFDLFHGRVLDYGWPDHHGPPLQVLIDVVANIDRWIRSDPKNVAIVHCLAGRGRTGTAICAYLCYAGYFTSMVKALQYYANVRSNKGKGVTQPSQLRYCKYIDIILNRPLTPKPKCVSITRITITPVPNMTSQLGIRPILNIYRYAPGAQELIWTSQKDTNEATFYGPKDGEITFTIPDISPIAGDVMIKLSHVTTWMWIGSKTEVIMRLIMNTSFFAEGQSVITLGKRDLDIAHKDSRFSQNTQLFLYSTVIPDGPAPSKHDWDPEKFDTWAVAAKENRLRLADSSAAPSGLRADPASIIFHPFSPPEGINNTGISTPPPTIDYPLKTHEHSASFDASSSAASSSSSVAPSSSMPVLNTQPESSSAPVQPESLPEASTSTQPETAAVALEQQVPIVDAAPTESEPSQPSNPEHAKVEEIVSVPLVAEVPSIASDSPQLAQEEQIIATSSQSLGEALPESNVPAVEDHGLSSDPVLSDVPLSPPTSSTSPNPAPIGVSANLSESMTSFSPEDISHDADEVAISLEDTSLESQPLS